MTISSWICSDNWRKMMRIVSVSSRQPSAPLFHSLTLSLSAAGRQAPLSPTLLCTWPSDTKMTVNYGHGWSPLCWCYDFLESLVWLANTWFGSDLFFHCLDVGHRNSGCWCTEPVLMIESPPASPELSKPVKDLASRRSILAQTVAPDSLRTSHDVVPSNSHRTS